MAFILSLYFFYMRHRENSLIEAWIKATLMWVGLAFVSLEVLSLFSSVRFSTLAIFWGVIDCLLLIFILYVEKSSFRDLKSFVRCLTDHLRSNMVWYILGGGIALSGSKDCSV